MCAEQNERKQKRKQKTSRHQRNLIKTYTAVSKCAEE